MTRLGRRAGTLVAVAAWGWATTAVADDWPQWQGPDRNAISKERGLLKEWPKDGPPLAWKVKGLGGGDSAPSVAGGAHLRHEQPRQDEVVWALSEKDGKELWATRLGPAFDSSGCRRRRRGRAARRRSMASGSMSLGMGGDLAACRSRTARSSGSAA